MYHQSVLLHDCIKGLNIHPDGIYVDVTFGGGGHSREILKHLGPNGKLFAFDQDPDAQRNMITDPRFTFIPQNFIYMRNFLKVNGVAKVDGILADLGVSSHQFDQGDRGFSIRFEGDLDMRMNPNSSKTAKEIINGYSEEDLIKMFKLYGEVENSKRIAQGIIEARTTNAIITTTDLKNIVAPMLSRKKETRELAKIFQAIRIEVNEEMDALEKFLQQCLDFLKPGGRLVIMSYHSLEDRLVKNYMRAGKNSGEPEKDFFGNISRPFELITKKPITPSEQELIENPRSRSAKLRIAEINKYGEQV